MTNQTKLGHNLYLWTPNGGITPEVVISCHGGMSGATFVARQGTVFHFYSVASKSAYGTLDKTLHPDQIKDTTDCNHARASWNVADDYLLSKFQGSHGGNSESYDDIKTFVKTNGRSVVSVRNRTGAHQLAVASPMTLGILVQLLETRYPTTLFTYHCLFCRVDSTGTSPYKNMLTGEAFTG